jgi:hypothetical protein
MVGANSCIEFRVDPQLSIAQKENLYPLLQSFKGARVKELSDESIVQGSFIRVDFISRKHLKTFNGLDSFKILLIEENRDLFSFIDNFKDIDADLIVDHLLNLEQLNHLISPLINDYFSQKESSLLLLGRKNLRKLENILRVKTQRFIESQASLDAEDLLSYIYSLVDLEKNLIHTEEIPKMEKIIRGFIKDNIDKTKFNFISIFNHNLLSKQDNFVCLPRLQNDFLGIDISWEDNDYYLQLKKAFLVHTLITFFISKHQENDPFFDEILWESMLDGIPFPVALLSQGGEIYQHNTLFSRLNLTPQQCLKCSLREKIFVHDIPYNVFRKDIHHLDEMKILFVFFTESFFLRPDNNHTPSGQELGIITSSIAHELNNPIAGIQAALGVLMLDEAMSEEGRQSLVEMKNGTLRCKQLVETFLGFSRATPRGDFPLETSTGPIEISYQQAQNLLRFRTVESGIRLSFSYSKHSDFRASVNLSLLTMTFYLIFGELMTLYSHHLLVTDKNQIEKVIKGELIESSQEIQFQLHELNISNLVLSKLIQNLLNIENFVLQISDYSLRFIYNPTSN